MTAHKYERVASQPENPFAALIPDQQIAIIPKFELESGVHLHNVPVAYSTRGKLSPNGDNCMVICHALTGSADVGDWWGPLLGGQGRAFDITRFFVVCLNSLGSPYGTASPVTYKDGDPSQGHYGPEFPLTTIRDDVRLHRLILDDIGVRQIAAVVGGSMGGMLVLEYAFFGVDYVRSIVPIATSSRHSAWGISWGEAQRQSIFSDPKYQSGYYAFSDPPATGLGAARMSALLTYRSRNSFEARFGRNIPDPSRRQNINGTERPATPSEHWSIHNDGHKQGRPQSRPHSRAPSNGGTPPQPHHAPPSHAPPGTTTPPQFTDPQFHGATPLSVPSPPPSSSHDSNKAKHAPHYFSAQSYLRYQGEKFVRRFDSNCYIAITKKLDMHDVSYGRVSDERSPDGYSSNADPVAAALATIQQPALVLGIESDGLFTFAEQQELAAHIPNATLCTIDSPEGHDAFLLQFEQVNRHILAFFAQVLPEIMGAEPLADAGEDRGWVVLKESTFGEAEVDDITAW